MMFRPFQMDARTCWAGLTLIVGKPTREARQAELILVARYQIGKNRRLEITLDRISLSTVH